MNPETCDSSGKNAFSGSNYKRRPNNSDAWKGNPTEALIVATRIANTPLSYPTNGDYRGADIHTRWVHQQRERGIDMSLQGRRGVLRDAAGEARAVGESERDSAGGIIRRRRRPPRRRITRAVQVVHYRNTLKKFSNSCRDVNSLTLRYENIEDHFTINCLSLQTTTTPWGWLWRSSVVSDSLYKASDKAKS